MNAEQNQIGAEKIEASTRKRKPVAKGATVGNLVTSFEVKSKGYQETFETMEAANKQADILKKRAIKNQESVNIKIIANKQDDEKPHVVRNIKIDESFFNS